MKYKFEIKDLLPVGITLVLVGIVLAFGLEIVGDVRDDVGASECAGTGYASYNSTSELCYQTSNVTNTSIPNSAQFNATGDTILGVGKLPEKLPLIATVLVAVIIIGILVRFFTVN